MAQKLSADVLQQMLDDKYAKKAKRFATHFDDNERKGKSYSDESYDAHMDLFKRLSNPLKLMQADYLKAVSEQCYKEKHMADDVPNEEQVVLCRERKHK